MAEHTFKINYKLTNGDEGTAGTFSLYDGEDGSAATIKIGEVVTLEPGEDAYVKNVGTDTHAVLNIGIPAGAQGEQGPEGPAGENAEITLNGDKVTNPNFYAPTESGTSGQMLQSNGEGTPPQWVSQSGSGNHLYVHSLYIMAEGYSIAVSLLTANNDTEITANNFVDFLWNYIHGSSDSMYPATGVHLGDISEKATEFRFVYGIKYDTSGKLKVYSAGCEQNDKGEITDNDIYDDLVDVNEVYDYVYQIF